jgi:hypothetical protein
MLLPRAGARDLFPSRASPQDRSPDQPPADRRRSFASAQPRLRTIRNKLSGRGVCRRDNAGVNNEQGHAGRARMPRFGRLRHANANCRDRGGRRGRSCCRRPGGRGSRRGSGRGGDSSWRAAGRRLPPSLPLDRSIRLRSHAQLVQVALPSRGFKNPEQDPEQGEREHTVSRA